MGAASAQKTMKPKHYAARCLACASLFLAVACDKKSSPPDSGSPQAGSAPSAQPARTADPNLPEKKVEIAGNDQMKFDVTSIEAKPNQKVTVTLKNIGTMPKVSMGHNFVLLERDMDAQKFMEAGTVHMATDFIAPEYKNKVIAHTKLLGPGESDTVSFVAPSAPGNYTYLCSFPGHLMIGMKGTLLVQ
jgi:azurin